MRNYVVSLLLLSSTLCSPASWAVISAAEAMNLSGMQRMLSQRIAKNYLMLGTDIRVEIAEQQLDQSIAKFESNYLALSEYAPTAKISAALENAGNTWQAYRELALTPPSPEQAVSLLALSDQLLAESEVVVQQLEQYNNNADAQPVNLSGRQRMLSQRIAKLYLALSWHLPIEQLPQSFAHTVGEFEQALLTLQKAPQNTSEINSGLQKVDAQWRFSQAGFKLSNQSRYVPTVIVTTTDTLTGQMNALTQQYEQVMAAQP